MFQYVEIDIAKMHSLYFSSLNKIKINYIKKCKKAKYIECKQIHKIINILFQNLFNLILNSK